MGYWEHILSCGDAEALTQRSCACPICGLVQGQVEPLPCTREARPCVAGRKQL